MFLVPIELRPTIAGQGVFTLVPIAMLQPVCFFFTNAELMPRREYDAKQESGDIKVIRSGCRYVLDHFVCSTLDTEEPENYINHDEADPSMLYHCGICFARRDIPADTELTFNYAYVMSENDSQTFTDWRTGRQVIGMPGHETLEKSTAELLALFREKACRQGQDTMPAPMVADGAARKIKVTS
ncbi:MAG: hypothetical protein GC131_05805 [Alphaproteobacteria bacterium]|nr:hypothetical protein [Alphaproteobacteria bacterium]